MEQPTNQMLIDALCIIAADRMDPVDLNAGGERAKIVHRAREIVAHYAPMAIARIMRERGVDSPELTDDQLSRLRPARGPGEEREGTVETFIDVTNTNGSGIRVEFKPSQYVAGVMLGEAHVKLVEIKGDPHHGLTDEQWALFQTLQEAFTAGQTLTFDFGGKTYTGVRIASLTSAA